MSSLEPVDSGLEIVEQLVSGDLLFFARELGERGLGERATPADAMLNQLSRSLHVFGGKPTSFSHQYGEAGKRRALV